MARSKPATTAAVATGLPTAESKEINEINIQEIPKMGTELTDLEMLKFRLIQP